jgi:hypothetical protein
VSLQSFNNFIEGAPYQDDVGNLYSFKLAQLSIPDDATILTEKGGDCYKLLGIMTKNNRNLSKTHKIKDNHYMWVGDTIKKIKEKGQEIESLRDCEGLMFYGGQEKVLPTDETIAMPRSVIIRKNIEGEDTLTVYVRTEYNKGWFDKDYVDNCIPFITNRAAAVFEDKTGCFEKALRSYLNKK